MMEYLTLLDVSCLKKYKLESPASDTHTPTVDPIEIRKEGKLIWRELGSAWVCGTMNCAWCDGLAARVV